MTPEQIARQIYKDWCETGVSEGVDPDDAFVEFLAKTIREAEQNARRRAWKEWKQYIGHKSWCIALLGSSHCNCDFALVEDLMEQKQNKREDENAS